MINILIVSLLFIFVIIPIITLIATVIGTIIITLYGNFFDKVEETLGNKLKQHKQKYKKEH